MGFAKGMIIHGKTEEASVDNRDEMIQLRVPRTPQFSTPLLSRITL
jgi:hypothetical protein